MYDKYYESSMETQGHTIIICFYPNEEMFTFQPKDRHWSNKLYKIGSQDFVKGLNEYLKSNKHVINTK